MPTKLKEFAAGDWIWLGVEINGRTIFLQRICRKGDCHRPGGG